MKEFWCPEKLKECQSDGTNPAHEEVAEILKKEVKMLISFDFDDTITSPNWIYQAGEWISNVTLNEKIASKLRKYAEDGHTCVIVTYRSRRYENLEWIAENMPSKVLIADFIKKHKLPIEEIHFTEHEVKGPVLAAIGASIHYDDDIDAVFSADWYGVHGVHVKVE